MKELIQALCNQGIITVVDIQRMTTLELLLTIIERVNELHGLTKEGLEATQRLLDKGVQEEVIAQFDKWKQDGTFDTLINQTNAQLSKLNHDFTLFPQSQLPAKQGLSECSNKLVIKQNDNTFLVVQKTNKGYLSYKLIKNQGDNGMMSVGGDFELLRLNYVEVLYDCVVWKKPIVESGTLTASIAPTKFSGVESALIDKSTSVVISNSVGLGLYDIAVGDSVTFMMENRKNEKANILYLANENRSNSVDIKVNNVSVKTLNSKKGSTGHYVIDYFDVPSSITDGTYELTITNNGTEKFSFVCFNYFTLKDYNGQFIDSYKLFRTQQFFISNIGASEYAIKDKEINKWCGSFHGGEKLEYGKCVWNSGRFLEDNYTQYITLGEIANNSFCVLNSLTMTQRTNINNKAKMTTTYDFDVDGTISISCGLSNSTILATDFYTSLTCATPLFNKISKPFLKDINTNGETVINTYLGCVEQFDDTNNLKLGIRYNVFNNAFSKRGHYIFNDNNYSKMYYGVVSGYDDGVILENLSFNKCLDFIVM